MLNAQSLRHHSMLAKIGRAMREAVTKAADRPAGAQVTVRNAKGRVTLVVQYSRVLGGLGARRTGFEFFDYTADLSRGPAPDITPLVLAVLRQHGDVADALPANPRRHTISFSDPRLLDSPALHCQTVGRIRREPAPGEIVLMPADDLRERQSFPYGQDAVGRRWDLPFTCR